jgi:hypothetical protein
MTVKELMEDLQKMIAKDPQVLELPIIMRNTGDERQREAWSVYYGNDNVIIVD